MSVPVTYGLLALLLFLSGCTGIPDGVSPVTGFDVNRYLGTWYEIARLDHSFERGLEQVTAEYSLAAARTHAVAARQAGSTDVLINTQHLKTNTLD